MRKRYLAMAMSFVLACTQLSGAVTVAHAADLIVEESYVEDVHVEDMYVDEAENLMVAEAEPEVYAEEVREIELLADQEELPGEYVSVEAEEVAEEENEEAEDAAEDEVTDAEEAGEISDGQDVISDEAAELNLEEEFVTSIEEVDTTVVEGLNLGADEEDAQENGEGNGDEEQGPQIFIHLLRDAEYDYTWLFEGETQTYYLDFSNLENDAYDVEWTVESGYEGVEVSEYVDYSVNENDNSLTMTAFNKTSEGGSVRVDAVVKNEAGEVVANTGFSVDVRRERIEPQWPGDQSLLPHETWDFSKWINCYVENPVHPYGNNNVSIEILSVETELMNGAEGAVECIPWEDGNGWKVQAHDYGKLEITLSYVPVGADKEAEGFEPEEYTFTIWAGSEKWEMGIDSNSNNCLMLPGSSYKLTANVTRRCYSEDEGHYDGDVSFTEIVWTKDDHLQVELSQTKPVRPDEYGNVSCTVTANENAESGNGGHVYAKTYLLDETGERVKDENTQEDIELALAQYYVEIHEGYYVLRREWDYWLDVGASVNNYTPQLLYYDVNVDEPEAVEADNFYWYGDSSIVNIMDGDGEVLALNWENGASGKAPFTITKLKNEHTDIKVIAVANEGTEQEIREEQNYWLNGINYSTRVNVPTRENGWTWLYTDEELTLTLDTRNITTDDGNLKDGLEIEWRIGQYDEAGNFTPLDQNFYTMTGDNTSVTLKGDVLVSEESPYEADTHFNVCVLVYMNNELVSEEEWAWIELREPRYDLNTNFGEHLEAFPNNTYRLERWANARFEDAEFCYEGEAQAYITNIEIEPHYGCADNLVYIENDDENNFWLRTAENHGGVTVKVAYEIRADKEDGEGNHYNPYEDQTFEDTFDIVIGGDRYELGISSSTGRTEMLPGGELNLSADLEYYWWDEWNECEERDSDVEVTQKDALLIEWGIDQGEEEELLTIDYDDSEPYVCHVTAAPNVNGESVKIWVRALVWNEEAQEHHERAYDECYIWVGSEYYVIDTTTDRNQNLGIGDSVEINPTVVRRYLDENSKEQEETLKAEDIIWRWEDWDENALKIKGSQVKAGAEGEEPELESVELSPENNSAMGPFTLTKLDNYYSNICLRAYSAEDPEHCFAEERWHFHEVDYSVEFQELRGDGYTWVYTDEDLHVNLNTENLENKGCTLEWTLGHFDEDECINEMTADDAATEAIEGQYLETESGIVLYGEAIEQWMKVADPERNDFDIRVKVMKNGNEVWQEGTGAHIRTSYYDLQGGYMDGIEGFPQQSYWIDRNQTCVLEDSIHPEENYRVGARITDLQVVPDEGSNGCAAIVYYDDNGYEIRTTNYGHAKVYVTYTICDAENEEDNHYKDFEPFTDEFDIGIGGDRYELEVSSDTGRNQLLPNASLNLNADVKYFYWDEENREEGVDEDPEAKETVKIEWGYEHPDFEEVVTLTEDENNPYAITVTANDITEDRNAWIYAEVQAWDEYDQQWYSRAYQSFEIWVNQGYVLIEADADRWNELEPGESIIIDPTAYLYENGEDESEITSELIWCWEDWDTNALQITGYVEQENSENQDPAEATENEEPQLVEIQLSPENNSAMGPFTLTKLSTYHTDIRLNAYWADNGHYAGEEWWTFERPNCDTYFEEMRGGNWTWVFSDETEYVIRLNQENLGNKDGYSVDWELGHFDENGNIQSELTEKTYNAAGDCLSGEYIIDAENDRVILDGAAVKEWFRNINPDENETPRIHVRAIISYEVDNANEDQKVEMSRCDADVDIWEPEESYSFMNDYPGDTWLMPGEWIWFSQDANCYVRNSSIPHGEDETIRILDVAVDMKEGSPAMAAECSWIDNEGEEDDGWHIYVHNPCEATVTVTYLPYGVESEDDADTYSFDLYGAGDMYYASIESSLTAAQLQPGQRAELKAVVSHSTLDGYYEDSEEGLLEEITVVWSAEPEEADGNKTVELEFEPAGEDGGRNCTVIAGEYTGRVWITASVYRNYTDEQGESHTEHRLDTTYEIEINEYQIEDYGDHVTMQEQYLLPGQRLEILPVLMNGETQYTGKIRYRLEYDPDYIVVSQEELYAEIPTEESGEENTGDPETVSEEGTEEPQEYTGPHFWIEKIQEGGTGVTLVAEIWSEAKCCYQEVSRREWYFNDVHRDLWFDHVRGDEYTWIYDDEMYEIWAHGAQGLLDAGRYVEWEIGYFGEEGPLHLCETEENTSEVPYTLSEHNQMITIHGDRMQAWIDSVSEDIKEQGDLVVIAHVVQEWYDEEGNVDKEYVANRAMGFDVREAYEEWEDQYITELLPGDFFSYINGTLTRYVENQKYPHGENQAYTITGITSTNMDDTETAPVFEVEEPGEDSKEWRIYAVNPGEAEITYTLVDESGNESKQTFTKYVADTVYYLEVRRDTNTNQMFPGQTQVLQPVVVKVAASVNEDEEIEYTRATLTPDQYTVEYINHNPDQITVSKDGHVTAEDYGEAWVELKVVVTLEDGEKIECYEGMDFYIVDRPYVAFSGKELYTATPDETITYTPELVQVDEQGDTKPYNGTYGITFELEESYSDVLNIEADENNTWTISPKDSEATTTAATIRVIARGTDEYGYPLEMDFWFDVSFCDHEYDDDNWVVFAWPGCETTGKRVQECIHCGLCCGEEEILAATGHAWSDWTVDKEETCTEDGAKSHICDTCEKAETTMIPAPGHTEVTDAAVAATCEGTGLTEGKHCSVCKEVLVAQKTVAVAGHKEVKDAAVAATCETTGLTEGKHCSVCEEVLAVQKTVAAAGHKKVKDAAVAATCETTGLTEGEHCSVCSKVLVAQKTVAASGHKSDAGTVTKEATCISAGTKTFKCTVCGKKLKEDPIPKLPGTIKPADSKLTIQLKKSVKASKLVSGLMEGDYIANVTTSNDKLVAVKKSGSDWNVTGKKVTSKKTGTADVTITLASGASATIKFSVQKAAVTTSKLQVTNAAKKLTLTVGDQLTLETLVKPVTTSDKLTFTTSNKNIVTVSKSGTLAAKKAGTATITVKSGKKSVKIKVTVKKLAPSSFTLNKTTLNLKVNKSATLKAKFAPNGSEGKVTFKTSNKKIATVNSAGKVTAKKKGTAVITATVTSATGQKLTKTCTVTVK